jgi:hypothetical protein
MAKPFETSDGQKFTNADAWRQHKASLRSRGTGSRAGERGAGVLEPEEEQGGEGAPITLHAHGDGSYHTETEDGEREEHPHIGHALMHMAHHHDPDAKHMHVHHDGEAMTTHHVGEDGMVQGPHDHENLEALKDHMDQFLDEEGHEGEEDGGYRG